MSKRQKLKELAKIEGMIDIKALTDEKKAEKKSDEEIKKEIKEIIEKTIFGMLNEATYDSVSKGICMNPGCNYTTDNIEPDGSNGYCENCGTNTVQSCLVIAGLI